MKYLSIETASLRSPEYIGSEPQDRATWLNLLGYCVEQENRGEINDCAGWKDRMWQQVCGVTRDEVMSESTLWEWDGCALIVKFYPHEAHDFTDKKRLAGKVGGKATTQAKTQASRENGSKNNPSRTQAEPKQNPSITQANVRKGNVMKGNEKKEEVAVAPKPLTKKLPDEEWFQHIKTLYPHVNLDVELRKMDAWFSVNPNRQKTRPFVINWLNRVPVPMGRSDASPRKADGSIDYYADAVSVFGEESVVRVAAV